jgi:hypothetical protein
MAIQSIAVNNARYEGVTSEMGSGLSGGITADGQEEEDRSYMTTQDADSDGTSGLKDSPEPPQATEPELDAYGLPVQKRARTAIADRASFAPGCRSGRGPLSAHVST